MALRCGDLTAIIEEVEHAHPFLVGHVHLAGKVVQVIDKGLEEELEATALLRLEAVLHGLRNGELIYLAHSFLHIPRNSVPKPGLTQS